MKDLFLYRLLRYSRSGFVCVMLFLFIYAWLYSKKMSMMLFPYNAMYSVDFFHNTKGSLYVMKIDNKVVPITHKWYWKKDFLETSLRGFAHYVSDSDRVYMDHYIRTRFHNSAFQNYLLRELTPGKIQKLNWARWYADFAGASYREQSMFELMRCDYEITGLGFQLTDSSKIWTAKNE